MSIDRLREDTRHMSHTATAAAHDLAERADTYTRHQLSRLAATARDLTRQANHRLALSTGRPMETWLSDTQRYLRTHPLQILGISVALGYVVGKLARR